MTNVSNYREYQRELHDHGNSHRTPPIRLLGPTRGLLAVSVIALGLLTFFIPLINTNPPAMRLPNWSVWGVVRGVQSGTFAGLVDEGFIQFLGFYYTVLAVNLIGLFLSPLFSVPKIQMTIALIEFMASFHAKYSYFGQKHWELRTMFYGESSSGHVNVDHLLTDLMVIAAVLVLVALDAILDPESSPREGE